MQINQPKLNKIFIINIHIKNTIQAIKYIIKICVLCDKFSRSTIKILYDIFNVVYSNYISIELFKIIAK